MATRNATEAVGEKEQRTNEQYGFVSTQSARRARLRHCIPCASVDYRWRVVFAKLLQATRNANSSLTVFLTADRCRLRTVNSCLSSSLPLDSISPDWSLLLSVVDCPSASPFANCLLWVPFFNCLLWRSLAHCSHFSRICLSSPTSGLVGDLDSKPFVWFRAKTDKGIVCLADHLHSVTQRGTPYFPKFQHYWRLTIRLFYGGARGVIVIVVGNELGDTSSNPRWDWLHFT